MLLPADCYLKDPWICLKGLYLELLNGEVHPEKFVDEILKAFFLRFTFKEESFSSVKASAELF